MADFKSEILAHGNLGLSIVDSDQVYGSIKNFVSDFTKFDDFNVESHSTGAGGWGVPGSLDYLVPGFNPGKFKPWSTLIYVEDSAPLVEVVDATSTSILIDGRHFDVNGTAAAGSFFVFKYDAAILSGSSAIVASPKTFVISENGDDPATAVPQFWVNMKSIVGGGSETDLSDISTSYNETNPDVLTPSGFTIGSINNTDGAITAVFPTNANIGEAFVNEGGSYTGNILIGNGVGGGNEQLIEATINASADMEVAAFTATTGTFSGAVGVASLASTGFISGDNLAATGTVTLSGLASNDSATTALVIDNNAVGTRALNAIAFDGIADGTYVDGIDVEHTPNDALLTENQVGGTSTITVVPSPILASSGSAGTATSLQLGPSSVNAGDAGADDVRLVVRGSADIIGDLTVSGALVTTQSTDVTFEDSTLTLNFLRQANGEPQPGAGPTTGNAGIEAWHGFGTDVQNNSIYARPFIRYEYDAGGGYGKWYLANEYADVDQSGVGSANAVSGYILTSLDVKTAVAAGAPAASDYHDPAADDNNISHVATPYGLLLPTTIGDGPTRKFGRVSTVTRTVGSDNEEVTLTHDLGTQSIWVCAVAETNLDTVVAGVPVIPKYKPVSDDTCLVKVSGVTGGVGQQVKYIFIG